MDSEDGELFVKQLATFVRTHEKALANALQMQRRPRHGPSQSVSNIQTSQSTNSLPLPERPATSASTSSALANALSLGSLSFASHSPKSTRLALTPHHLFYMLSRFEDLGINRTKSRGSDAVSIRSVSSIRSVMSGMSALWSSLSIGSSIAAARNEKQKAALQADLKYLYSAFTKIPCLRLAPDWRAKLIRGYEEFPFDSAVPLYVFKNLQALEVSGIDFRQFFGWDRVAEQIRSLTLKNAGIEDPADILIDIVLDDMDKRRRRSAKAQTTPTGAYAHASSPKRSPTDAELRRPGLASTAPGRRNTVADLNVGSIGNESAESLSPHGSRRASVAQIEGDDSGATHQPASPAEAIHPDAQLARVTNLTTRGAYTSASNLLAMGILPASKWRFLKHLSLADNSLTVMPAASLMPLANTLNSLDLSTNLFTQIPDSLATLTALRALNLSHCMIDSLHSLLRNPLPAISALNLRCNRLSSIAGIEKLYPLERLDLRDNRLTDPLEIARLTGIPDIREIWVEGNPFTRTHRDYRITIFNLFRETPGFTEDIIIDASGPTSAEKRYLVDRVAVPAAVPVVKPPVAEVPVVDVSKPAIIYDGPRQPTVLRKERPARPTPKAVTSEINTSSTRRRRTPKRRIVDLAVNERPTAVDPQSGVGEPASDAKNIAASPQNNYRISQTLEKQELPAKISEGSTPSVSSNGVPRIDTNCVSKTTLPSTTLEPRHPWGDLEDWSAGGEIYRQKIEALRDKVGNGYLSALDEETWDASRPAFISTDFGSTSPIHSGPGTSRIPSAPVIHSSGTLV
ncbi:hypothetical protein NPX13_g644 [Xylaria arbuscula]|uniref:Leucine-rich repeat-containing protein n=1 Tax=Xylaria arbuscula TaxID=114810 RepID=A0A9W8TQC3_9PEZI|nr:hypothetical protein NPX13_g644 [Xylaria arbuscula]